MNQEQTKFTDLSSSSPGTSHSYMGEFTKIYESVFMDRGEREDSENPSSSLPWEEKTAISLDQEITLDSHVIGLMFTNGEKNDCGLLAYVVVAPKHQRNSIARDLRRYAAELLKKIQDGELQISTEMKEQEKFSDTDPIEKALTQASILSKLVVMKVDASYARRKTISEQEWREHLLYFPGNQDSPAVNGVHVAEFLFEFYKGLNAKFGDMIRYLSIQAAQVTLPESRYEEPKLSKLYLKRTSICFHFVERNTSTDKPFDYDEVFGSMERDLLKYQFQASPPLDSNHCSIHGSNKLEIVFPSSFNFHSEGRHIALISKQPPKTVKFMLNKTGFRESKIRIWHLTLSTDDNDPLNEYEIIKLISLYDGRSEDTGPYTKLTDAHSPTRKLAHDIKFNYDGKENLSINDLIVELISECSAKPKEEVELKSGTIQILLTENKHMELLRLAVKARSDDAAHKEMLSKMKGDTSDDEILTKMCAPKEGTPDKEILQALSGIAIGIFDFEETDNEEILDTFEPSFSDASVFIKFNRCTLLSIVKEDRAWDTSKDKIGTSPYLIIPHAVLIHNEELVEMAEEKIDGPNAKEARHLFKLGQLEESYVEADRYLHSLYLPMIFNYPTEKTLFEKGNQNRGSTEKYEIVQFKLRELHNQIESLWQTRRALAQAFIPILLALISLIMGNKLFEISTLATLALFIAILIFVAVSLAMLGKTIFNRDPK